MGKLFHHEALRPQPTDYCGRIWKSDDRESLARAIADLALGQCAHVERLLKSTGSWQSIPATYSIDSAIKSLTVPQGMDPWHRDGWVFQLISWIAAIEESDGLTRFPQMDQASKGFDGFQLEFDPGTGKVARAVISEDKATDSPRDTVREMVWPEFVSIERGDRHPRIAVEIGALLNGRYSLESVTEAVDRLLRTPEGLAYRASVTAGQYHTQARDFNGLFNDFESSVPGSRARRRGNVLEVDNLRDWMDALCFRAVEILKADRHV
ncbi:hypothetical protein [Pseudoclavibacter sp. 13-3]|uniref:hypothetical protein n=1 Tax=Pseudoclavibacter sp. 13-3 TaxID=2901228 RepID=UPI001E37B904|nr:hypothetical protein [Pseudoclavibacter sp. 13-3]MCD7100718.1 hypothetical protein [Pseudoclavibacter sp. 13-3]